MNDFLRCFVPLLVAVDAVGALPVFLALTEGITPSRLRVVIVQSVTTAVTVALLFVLFGPALLRFLGITTSDFMVAGGLMLLAISLMDLLRGEERQAEASADTLGVVPIGVPLITGPAVLTTSLLLEGLYGKGMTSLAVVMNIGLAGGVFALSRPIATFLGRTGTRAVSKVTHLLLAAIAVMLVRRGLMEIVRTAAP